MLKDKIKYFLGLLAVIGCTGFISTVSAETITPTGAYKTSWNIESIYYYIDQSAPGYSGTISGAANNWVYTGLGYNKLYPNTRTYNKTSSAIDFYASSDGNNGVLAYTNLYKRVNGNPVTVTWVTVKDRVNSGVPSESWLFSEIHINNDVFQNYDFTVRQGTVAHEFGHAWGLGHNNENPNSLMCQTGFGRVAQTVQQVDQDAFNRLYN